jgi:hypothetical protein
MDLKFPATQPDQMLCFENKRRIINEKHSAWMQQRDAALAAENESAPDGPSLRGTLADVHREAMAAISRYDDEKRQLSKLPPARRRAAMQEKRASWMEQRVGEETPSLAPRERQPAEAPGTAHTAAATDTGNTLLRQLHAERLARATTPVNGAISYAHFSRQAAPSGPVSTKQVTRTIAARSTTPPTQASPSLGWACRACTFAHAAPALECEMCGTPRDPAPSKLESRCDTVTAGAVDDLDAELGLEDGRQLEEIEDFLAAVELDLQRDD